MSAKITPRGFSSIPVREVRGSLAEGMKPQEKASLQFQLGELIDGNEPEAVIATLRRVAERMCQRSMKEKKKEDADRWIRLLNALVVTQRHLADSEMD